MKLADAILLTSTQFGAVALDERSGRYFQANHVGALILDVLRRSTTTEAIATRVVASTGAEYATALADVEAYCRLLRSKGLLQ